MMTVEQIRQQLQQVLHPEIGRDLVALGMIKGVTVAENRINITLALPFKDVPVKDDLVRSLRQAVAALDPNAQLEVHPVEMS